MKFFQNLEAFYLIFGTRKSASGAVSVQLEPPTETSRGILIITSKALDPTHKKRVDDHRELVYLIDKIT